MEKDPNIRPTVVSDIDLLKDCNNQSYQQSIQILLYASISLYKKIKLACSRGKLAIGQVRRCKLFDLHILCKFLHICFASVENWPSEYT